MKKEVGTMSNKKTVREPNEKAQLEKRLKIIEGQVRGIRAMVEEERYCTDILIQIAAVNKALKSIANIILESHLKNCLVKAIKEQEPEVIDELMNLIKGME